MKSSKHIYRKSTFVQLVIYIFFVYILVFFPVLNENDAVITFNVLFKRDLYFFRELFLQLQSVFPPLNI